MTAAQTVTTNTVFHGSEKWNASAFSEVTEWNAIPAKKDALGRWVPLFMSRFISVDGVVYQWQCERFNQYGDLVSVDYRAECGALMSFVESHDIIWPSWEHPARRNRVKETLWFTEDGQVMIAIKKS